MSLINKMIGLAEALKKREAIKKPKDIKPWQLKACEYAEKLGVKLDAQWFRLFKYTPESCLARAYSYCFDRNPTNMRLMFFKMASVYRKELNVIRDKTESKKSVGGNIL